MSIKQDVLADLRAAGLSPNHRFGQNFMVDESALSGIIDAAEIKPDDRVLEIGPGTGLLTERILKTARETMAVEIDQGMYRLLQGKFADTDLQLVHGDALENKNTFHEAIRSFVEKPWKLVANLPYDVSLPVILNALSLPCQPSVMVVTVQKEAAERLCSRAGNKTWGSSAAVAQSAGSGRIIRKLGPKIFYPPPRVDSAILLWNAESVIPLGFPAWCKRLFGFRRKVISRALRDAGVERDLAVAICDELSLADGQRVEDLEVETLQRLFAALQARV